tara:strand:+ start:462 stop:1535 length:1074 start_codon:yes stop_codon:yes gene_type:complete
LNNSFKALKFIYYLARFNPEKYPKVHITDDFYNGIDGNSIPLKILDRFNKNSQSTIILFPGASPDAENHQGMLFLGSIISKLGHKVIIPRIPPLKELRLNEECFNWFAHAYEQIMLREDIIKNKVSAMALSFGGAVLLKSSLDSRISSNPPNSIMTFGTYSNIQTTLKFLCDGKIDLNNKSYKIKPHSWGLTVLFHNFLEKFNFPEIKNYKNEFKKIINLQIEDKHDKVKEEIKKISDTKAQNFIQNIFDCKINKHISNEIFRVIDNEKEFIKIMSPLYWADKVNSKVFIMHGSNDSMVPFTESINLDKYLKNSSLFISYMYEHKEISTNKGIIFKLKEFYKMYCFFKKYFKYSDSN